nr:DNA polymerase III subunit gamma/tau C-terminal domain-containing protein [Candidatus Hamiltonella defensa]
MPRLSKQTTENVAALNNKAPETPIVEVLNTTKILKTRTKLLELQYAPTSKKKENLKNELSVPVEKLIVQSNSFIAKAKKKAIDDSNTHKFSEKELLSKQKVLSPVLEDENSPELLSKLLEEVIKRDPWAAEVEQLGLPKLVYHLALNSFKKQTLNHKIYLHLRSAQRHLNSDSAHKILTEALNHFYNNIIEIIIIEDDDALQLTPWELRKQIYEEMLTKACQSIIADDTIHTLCGLFDAEIDKNSIRPI